MQPAGVVEMVVNGCNSLYSLYNDPARVSALAHGCRRRPSGKAGRQVKTRLASTHVTERLYGCARFNPRI